MTTQPITRTWRYRPVARRDGRWYIEDPNGNTVGNPDGHCNENDARRAIYQLDKAR